MIDEIIKERKRKVSDIKDAGVNPYPASSKRTENIGDIVSNFLKFEKRKKKFYIAGRIRGLRDQGKILFIDLEDFSGRIQVVARKDDLKNFQIIKKDVDTGDFLQARGIVFKTKSKEKSVLADEIVMLSKSLRALPSDFYGIENQELRLRNRYLDTTLNKDAKDIFVKKAKFWKSVREFLETDGFTEVFTEIIEPATGGAEAEPFVTHYNALDEDFYLRISPELALKKMIIGGFEKIYEIGRIFRNEGIDAEHLQDYTQCEFYWAYQDYNGLMKFVEKMYKRVIKSTLGALTSQRDGKKINWGKKWGVVEYCDIFKKKIGIDPIKSTRDELHKRAISLKIDVYKNTHKGKLIDVIFKKSIRPSMIQPTFLINPPVLIEPLAKRSRKNPDEVERFQIIACGTELGKGFSEENDPQDQRKRFEEQALLREKGDKEAHMINENFLEALEYGMPPTAGFGFSERLFAILINKPVREIVFSPPMKRITNNQ